MGSAPNFFVFLFFIGSAILLVNASSEEDDFQLCESVVNNWATSQLNHEFKEDKHTLRDLLFFLHIPRTGGRTYFHCFLKKLYSTQLECPRSYDKLRFNPRKANCRLLVTHDDYSMMSKLPKEKTSVVTILRNPVDRVFSTYEFSIEVAARFLVHSNLTSVTQLARRLRKKSNAVSTLDIWPWKYLVPWMREDLFARRDARLRKKQNHVGRNDSYDMEHMAMPLHQYINDPMALDIVHNGATFQIISITIFVEFLRWHKRGAPQNLPILQAVMPMDGKVAGLTNNSNLVESHEVRACIQKHPALGDSVLDVAKRRLDHMLYVGLTEDHKESATTFAHVVGAQVISQLGGSNSSMDHLATNLTECEVVKPKEISNKANLPLVFVLEHLYCLRRKVAYVQHPLSRFERESLYWLWEQSSPLTEIASEISLKNSQVDENLTRRLSSGVAEDTNNSKMTVRKLTEAYEDCVGGLRKSQARRRVNSLSRISPVNFTKEARLQVTESVIQQIISLNRLDMELYKYAQDIFDRQHKHTLQELMQESPKGVAMGSFAGPPWKDIYLVMAIVVGVLALCVCLNARRRTSKVKV